MKSRYSWFEKMLVVVWLFGTVFLFSGIASSTTGVKRGIDAELGLLVAPITEGSKYLQSQLKKALVDPIEAEAFFGGPVYVIGSFEAIVKGIIKAFFKKFLGNILDKMFQIFDNIISFLESWANIFKNLSSYLSGYRAAMAFEAFASLQVNQERSRDFITRFTGEGAEETDELFFLSQDDFSIASDAVAWLDFVTILKALNIGVISDFIRSIIGYGPDEFNDIKYNLVNIALGARCNDYASVNTVFTGELFGVSNGCITENGSGLMYMLDERAEQAKEEANAVLAQKTAQEPANCQGVGYVAEVDDSGAVTKRGNEVQIGLTYATSSNRGELSDKLEQIGKRVKAQPLLPEECKYTEVKWQYELESIDNSDKGTSGGDNIGDFVLDTVKSTINNKLTNIYQRITNSINLIINSINAMADANLEILATIFTITTAYRSDIAVTLDEAVKNLRDNRTDIVDETEELEGSA